MNRPHAVCRFLNVCGMPGAGHTEGAGAGHGGGHVIGDGGKFGVVAASQEEGRGGYVAELVVERGLRARAHPAEAIRKATRVVCKATAADGAAHALGQARLRGEQRQGLPLVDEGGHALALDALGESFIGGATALALPSIDESGGRRR